MSSSSGWRRCAGLVSTSTPIAARAGAFLDGALVVALVESDPDAPYSVAVTVAVDEERRVAVLSASRTEIVPGPPLGELAEALAAECQGLVVFEDIVAEGADAPDTEEPFWSDIDLSSTRLPERAVAVTRATPRELHDLATEANTPLAVVPHEDRQVVFVQDGPALTSLQWRDDHLPVVLLEHGESFPSVTILSEPGQAHMHSWDATITVVPEEAAEVVGPFVTRILGRSALVRALLEGDFASDEQMLTTALEEKGEHGLATMVRALQLPPVVHDFLTGEVGAEDLTDAEHLDPLTVSATVRRAMDEAAEEARAQARAHMEHVREVADEAREQARAQARANMEQMRRTATEASEAAYRIADPEEHPTLAWTTPAAGVLQLAGALYALRKSLQHIGDDRRAGKWWGLLSGVLGTASAGNLTLSVLPWVRRRRERTQVR
ncbi:MAG TPA: hypothetical protein VK063_01030 [Beutenbergiaceae bacterium]|nr:hypothetical protein [Beutenbergiaceae bacterium]